MRESAQAMRIDLRNTCVMGSRVLGMDADGKLFQWVQDRWAPLVLVDLGPRRAAHVRRGMARDRRESRR